MPRSERLHPDKRVALARVFPHGKKKVKAKKRRKTPPQGGSGSLIAQVAFELATRGRR